MVMRCPAKVEVGGSIPQRDSKIRKAKQLVHLSALNLCQLRVGMGLMRIHYPRSDYKQQTR